MPHVSANDIELYCKALLPDTRAYIREIRDDQADFAGGR
jgi:hypothetical protein